MTQKKSILTLSILAAAAIAAEHFVTATGAVATAAGNAIGTSVTDANDGDLFAVDVLGTSVVTAGGAFSEGDYLEVGANGTAVELAAGVAVAIALQDASASGDRVEVLLIANVPA